MNTIPLQSVVWKSASLQDLSQYIYIFLHEVRVPAFKKSIVMFFPPEPMRFVYKITLILNLYRSIFITLSVMLFFWVQPWQCCLTLSSSKKNCRLYVLPTPPLHQWPYMWWGRSIQFWNKIWIFLEYLLKPFSTSLLCPFSNYYLAGLRGEQSSQH